MRRSTRELALCSVMAALGVVFLCLGGIIPLALYACPILASAVLLPVREDCRKSYGWCCYAVIAILGLFLCPDKEVSSLFLFLGYYPLIKPRLDAIGNPALKILCKLLVASAAMAAMYGILLYVFCLAAVVEEFSATTPWMLWTMMGLGLLLFVVYDVLLGRFAQIYRRKRHRK